MAKQIVGYWDRVKQMAAALKGDGCTSAPDLTYRVCCDEHDIHYRTGKTIDGKPLTRAQADAKLFACMRKKGVTPVIGKLVIPTVYWAVVRLFAGRAWSRTTQEEIK